jgi:hypothetical protein
VAGPWVYDNVLSGSIKCEEFLDTLTDCQLFKKDSGLWTQVLPRRVLVLRSNYAVKCQTS